MKSPTSVLKALSANDLGVTGAHQAGICVPKKREILEFFPTLPSTQKNPRLVLPVRDHISNEMWEFNYIYYNNRFFEAKGTRNEYRLTGMTRYLKMVAAEVGDEIEFTKDENGSFHMRLHRKSFAISNSDSDDMLVLRSGWIVINR